MPTDIPLNVIRPGQFQGLGETGPFPAEMFERKYLAQGDSWFSIGSIPFVLTTNVLAEMVLSHHAFAVTCAFPGAKLVHMTDTTSAVNFLNLLRGRLAFPWDAILLSGGGNDLIDAIGVDPEHEPALRLLATPEERGPGPLPPEGYVCEAGWKTFSDHMRAVFGSVIAARDRGINKGIPLVFHTYAPLVPRPAPAGQGPLGENFGPWLMPSMVKYGVPQSDWPAVATTFVDRLADLLQSIVDQQTSADPNCALHLVDTRTASLQLAPLGSAGVAGDFQNEIHLTRTGYRKVADVWRTTLDALPARPG